MPVFRWGRSWDPFRDLEREVDQLLANVSMFHGIRFDRQHPPINVYELNNELLLTAELPGTRAEDLEVLISEGVLTIKGKRSGPEGINDDRFRRQERPRGNWQRSLTLPDRIQEDKLAAEFTNGVLCIRLPKAHAAQPRQIQVTNGNPVSPANDGLEPN
jgi:HSP20 family protein